MIEDDGNGLEIGRLTAFQSVSRSFSAGLRHLSGRLHRLDSFKLLIFAGARSLMKPEDWHQLGLFHLPDGSFAC